MSYPTRRDVVMSGNTVTLGFFIQKNYNLFIDLSPHIASKMLYVNVAMPAVLHKDVLS